MAERTIFTKKEEKFLEALIEHNVSFMIVGLAAATLQGAPVVTQDIDLWFKNLDDENILKALKKVNGVYIPPISYNPPMFSGANLEFFDIVLSMSGLKSFEEEELNTEQIKIGNVTAKVLKLERIIESKKAAGRNKDKLSLPVLEDALKVLKSKS
ncbi:MAG: hypothetical protein KDD56_03215 [Bdellovibrionales bacterium]|nr:hypothetical protein [Bdellovibrionales bacterium]